MADRFEVEALELLTDDKTRSWQDVERDVAAALRTAHEAADERLRRLAAAVRALLDTTHQPNPTDPNCWHVGRGRGVEFSLLVRTLRAELDRDVKPDNEEAEARTALEAAAGAFLDDWGFCREAAGFDATCSDAHCKQCSLYRAYYRLVDARMVARG